MHLGLFFAPSLYAEIGETIVQSIESKHVRIYGSLSSATRWHNGNKSLQMQKHGMSLLTSSAKIVGEIRARIRKFMKILGKYCMNECLLTLELTSCT